MDRPADMALSRREGSEMVMWATHFSPDSWKVVMASLTVVEARPGRERSASAQRVRVEVSACLIFADVD